MKLSDFSVVNYRSITTARKIKTNNMTVLVGKNNEGKSNILRALTLAMDIMKIYSKDPRSLQIAVRPYLKNHYSWEKDYPISLQEKNPNGWSSIDLNFELDEQDILAIRSMTGIRLSGCIPVRVSTNGAAAKIDIPKRGTAAFADADNKKKIIEYVCFKIDFNFIPAVRTEYDALRVVDSLIEKSLETLDTNPDYINAMNKIEELQQGILDGISNQIIEPLQEFLPTVRNVQIHIQNERRRIAMRRNTEIIIDDGTPTPIQQKGDGIKSLTALAILNIPARVDRVSVVAIEEPESHLHPESARQLYDTIMSLSQTHQIVLTTHSPLFVNRTNLKENIIVNEETGEHTCSDTSIGKMKNFTVTGNVIAACEKPGNRGVFSITKEIAQEETNVVPNLAYGSNVTPSVEGFEDNVNLTYSEYMANKESYLAKLNLAEMGVPSAEVEESVFAPKVGFPYDGGIYDSIGEINWSKAPGADKYHITLSKNADLSDPVAEKETIYTTLKIADALEDGTYYYRIDGIRKSNNLSRTDTGEVRSFKISDAKAYASSGSLNALPCDGSVKIELPQKYSGITADLIKLKDKDGAEIEANIEVKDNAATVSGKNMLAPEHSYVIEINHSTYPISVSFKTAKKISVTKTTGDELLNVTVKSMLEKNQLSYNAFYAESDSNGKLLNVRQSGQKTLEAGMEKTEQFSFLKDSALGMLYIWDKQMPLTDKIKIK